MFSNFFQSVKEIAHGPSVQDGQKIRKSSNASITATTATTLDEDGEMTEEGFVSIGRSSFICPSSDPIYPPLIGMETMTKNTHQMQMTMPMPFGQSSFLGQPPPTYQTQNQNHGHLQTHPSLEFCEGIRHVPMVLHPRLNPHIPMYDPKNPIRVTTQKSTIDFSEFNYDFEFERGVLRDIDQQMDISNEDNNANVNPNWTADWVNFD